MERIEALMLTDRNTILNGWIIRPSDKEGNIGQLIIDTNYHPYIEVGKTVAVSDIWEEYKVQDRN